MRGHYCRFRVGLWSNIGGQRSLIFPFGKVKINFNRVSLCEVKVKCQRSDVTVFLCLSKRENVFFYKVSAICQRSEVTGYLFLYVKC